MAKKKERSNAGSAGGAKSGNSQASKKEVRQIVTSICLRCPAPKLFQDAGKLSQVQHDLKDCAGKHDDKSADELWWAFPAGSGEAPASITACQQILAAAERIRQDDALQPADSLQQAIDQIREEARNRKHGKQLISKGLLEACFKKVHLRVAAVSMDHRDTAEPSTSQHALRLQENAQKQSPSTTRLCGKGESHRDARAVIHQPATQRLDPTKSSNASELSDYISSISRLPSPSNFDQVTAFEGSSAQVAQNRQSSAPGKEELELHALRPDFASGTRSTVLINHCKVEIAKDTLLYVYHVGDIPANLSPAKQWVLLLDYIESNQSLWNKRDRLATDFKSIFVSYEPLDDNPTSPIGSSMLHTQVDFFKAGSRETSWPKSLHLSLVAIHDLNSLQDFLNGRNENYKDTGAAHAINIMLAKEISGGNNRNTDTFQIGSNRFYYRPGWADLQDGSINDASSDPTVASKDVSSVGKITVRGYFASIKPAMGAVLLNMNTVSSVFFKAQSLLDLLRAMQRKCGGGSHGRELMDAHVRGLRVHVNFDRAKANGDDEMDEEKRRKKTIAGFGANADSQKIKIEDGSKTAVFGPVETKVWDHFSKKHPESTKNQDAIASKSFPCVNVGRREAGKEKFYLASQLDVIGDQIYRGTLTSDMISGMINFARRSDVRNYRAILLEGFESLGLSGKDNTTSFGITVKPGMLEVPAFELRSPIIHYANGALQARTGFWKAGRGSNLEEIKLSGTYGSLSNRGREPAIRFYHTEGLVRQDYLSKYIQNFVRQLVANGILDKQSIDQNIPWEVIKDWSLEGLKTRFRDIKSLDLAVVIFPNNRHKDKHNNFKTVMDQVLGIRSICLCEANMLGSNRDRIDDFRTATYTMKDADLSDYMRNLALKINLRLGNFNHQLEAKDLPKIGDDTIILGADVAHPGSAGAKGTPSIAAVVGSVDVTFARFFGSMRLNKARDDIIEDMTEMTIERLRDWSSQRQDRRLPSKILFYRDGVGESRFSEPRKTEVVRIVDAWSRLFEEFHGRSPLESEQPKITVIVTTKRHHTRFYPKQLLQTPTDKKLEDAVKSLDKLKCPAGTVVHSGITSPYVFDFYLLSHNGIAGTPRPTHYFVLQDGINFSANELQTLTFNLCHLYGRFMTSVSYAPAAYFADRLCEKGLLFLKPFFDMSHRDQSEEEVRKDAERVFYGERPGQIARRNPWHPRHDKTMFWM